MTRHENKFQLLGGVPGSYNKLGKNYQYRRASWRFKSEGEFKQFLSASGGNALKGGYWVNGSLSLGSYSGSGSIACSGDVNISGGATNGYLTVYSGKNITAGSTKAALLAPEGSVSGGPINGLVVENYHPGDISVTHDSSYDSAGPDGSKMWVTVSPYPVATNFLRKRTKMKSTNRKQGVTMLEIALAVVLLALAIVPMMGLLQNETKQTALNRNRIFAHHLANNIIERLRMEPLAALKGKLTDRESSQAYLASLELLNPTPPGQWIWKL